jgi:hypothetical protein
VESDRTDPLVVGLAAGDQRAFAELYDRYAVRLYRAAVGVLGRREDADDAVQEVFAAMLQSSHNLAGVRSVTASIYRVFLLADDLAAEARFAGMLRRAARLPYDEAKERMELFRRELRGSPGGILTASLMPGEAGLIEYPTRAEARRSVARLGVSLYVYRARNGHFPQTLEALVPDFLLAVPHDPYGGQPIKFKRTEHGVTVYSIGPDMTDNGGAPFDRQEQTGDITFTVQMP